MIYATPASNEKDSQEKPLKEFFVLFDKRFIGT